MISESRINSDSLFMSTEKQILPGLSQHGSIFPEAISQPQFFKLQLHQQCIDLITFIIVSRRV